MSYKLTYLNLTGLAEPIRFLLSYGNLDFEDKRIEWDDFPKVKNTMPMGQVPVLEVDGKIMHQSISICRFLAKRVGLDGKTDFENFEIDSVADTVSDFRQKLGGVHFEPDLKVKEEKFKLLTVETIPFYLEKLDEIAKANNGHLALKRLTWADLFFAAMIDFMSFFAKQDLLAKHSNLKKVKENVLALESIKKWVAKRPKSEF